MKFENGKIEARLNDLFFDVALVAMLKNIDHGMIYRAHHHMAHSCAFCAAQHGQTHLDLVARAAGSDRKSTRLNSSHYCASRMPSSPGKKKNTTRQPNTDNAKHHMTRNDHP